MVYDRAQRHNRLPHEAAAVLEIIRARLRNLIRETRYQMHERPDREFSALVMARNVPHHEFRAQFEKKIDEMEVAGMQRATDKEYRHHKYLAKIPDDMRRVVTGQLWPLEGPEKPPRKQQLWEEVAQRIVLEYKTRADAGDPKHDAINALGDGPIYAGSSGG